MQKHTNKYLKYTKEEIDKYVENFKTLVKANKFKISDINRDKNIKFINKYHLNTKSQKKMLLEIETNDFCYAVDDYNSNDILYIFSKEYEIDYWGEYQKVAVYIKINIKRLNNGEYALIVSFHEREKNINFLFK